MNNSQKKKILLLLLGVAIFIWVDRLDVLSTPEPVKRDERSLQSILDVKKMLSLNSSDSLRRRRKFSRYVDWGRDPFYVKVSSDVDHMPILEGIMWDDENPVAIINGEVVRKGDEIGNYNVVVVNEKSVIIADGQKTNELKVDSN